MQPWKIRGCLDKKIFITHYSFFHTCLASSPNFHHSIFFTLFIGPYVSASAAFSFSFFFQYPNSPKINKKKKKKKNRTAKKKGKKKKSKVVKSCGWVLFVGPLCVFNYNIAIELWVMETENSQNVFSISIIHNSKIRELCDGKRVMKTELSFAKQPFCHESHHFWVISYGNQELSYGNS